MVVWIFNNIRMSYKPTNYHCQPIKSKHHHLFCLPLFWYVYVSVSVYVCVGWREGEREMDGGEGERDRDRVSQYIPG